MKNKTYQLVIKTDGEEWYTKSSILSKKEAESYFNAEDVKELAENSTVIVYDNLGNEVFKKSN